MQDAVMQDFKDTPTLANWIKNVSNTLNPNISSDDVVSAAKMYNTDPAQIKDALEKLGKTVSQ
jgi:hypothetical protein